MKVLAHSALSNRMAKLEPDKTIVPSQTSRDSNGEGRTYNIGSGIVEYRNHDHQNLR